MVIREVFKWCIMHSEGASQCKTKYLNYEIKSEHSRESDTTSWTLNSCRISLCGAQSSTSVCFSLASLFTPVEEIGFKGYTQNYMASPQNKSVQLFTEPSLCTNPSRPSSFLCLGLHYESFLDREVMLVSATMPRNTYFTTTK